MAGDRALRVRSAIVDAHLLNALGVAAGCRDAFFARRETGVVSPTAGGGDLGHELWRALAVFGARPIVGHSVDVDGRRLRGRRRHGAAARISWTIHTEIWLPLGFTDDEPSGAQQPQPLPHRTL